MSCKSCFCHVNMRIAIAVIGVFVGILAGVWFAGEYRNFNSAAFGFVSAILALITLIVHIKYKRHSLAGWAKRVLFAFIILGCFAQLVAIAAFCTYIALAVTKHQDLSNLHGEIYWISLVWAWMTWKWGFALFWFSRKYRNEYLSEERHSSEECNIEVVKIGKTQNVNVSADGELRE